MLKDRKQPIFTVQKHWLYGENVLETVITGQDFERLFPTQSGFTPAHYLQAP
jgi:hypothetical protein